MLLLNSTKLGSRAALRYGNAKKCNAVRNFSLKFVDVDDDFEMWPKRAVNTVLNVCPQGEEMVVERLGKFHSTKSGGWFLAIPAVDNIRFVVDMRERALNIQPQSAITKDNVHVMVSGNLYCQFVSSQKAAYGSKNPIYAGIKTSQNSMIISTIS